MSSKSLLRDWDLVVFLPTIGITHYSIFAPSFHQARALLHQQLKEKGWDVALQSITEKTAP